MLAAVMDNTHILKFSIDIEDSNLINMLKKTHLIESYTRHVLKGSFFS